MGTSGQSCKTRRITYQVDNIDRSRRPPGMYSITSVVHPLPSHRHRNPLLRCRRPRPECTSATARHRRSPLPTGRPDRGHGRHEWASAPLDAAGSWPRYQRQCRSKNYCGDGGLHTDNNCGRGYEDMVTEGISGRFMVG